MLAGFAVVMVLLLMLDDPTAKQALLAEMQAVQESQRMVSLFPELSDLTQVYGLEVLDVASAQDILLMRDDQGLWYAPSINSGTGDIAADSINQQLADDAALSIQLMAARQWYDATPDNFENFGLTPEPAYRVRFIARDTTGTSYAPVILEVGDANPDNVAYYVWPQDDSRIYLIQRPLVDPLLSMLTDNILMTPTPAEPSPDYDMAPAP
jgi:hypothetical protein